MVVRFEQVGMLPWIKDYPEIGKSKKVVLEEVIPMGPLLQEGRLSIDNYEIEEGVLFKGLVFDQKTGVITGKPEYGGWCNVIVKGKLI